MLEAINIECLRGDRHLFSKLSFILEAGECLLIQGANGSGKSSLLRILAGLVAPGAGALHWNRRPIKPLDDEYRREVSYLGHSLGLKDDLSALENLDFASAVANEPVNASAVREALYRVGLRGKESLPVGALSQGQKRRVSLARLLLNRRAVWVLDEPLTALDAQATQWVVETVERHLEAGGLAGSGSQSFIIGSHARHSRIFRPVGHSCRAEDRIGVRALQMINWFKYASPRTFYPLAGKLIPWFSASTVLLTAAGLYIGFFMAPTDAQQGEAYRIIFVHVPASWMA